jgi:hypothetical protein
MNRWTKILIYDDGRDMVRYTPTNELVQADLRILRRVADWVMLVDTDHLLVSTDVSRDGGVTLIYYRDCDQEVS